MREVHAFVLEAIPHDARFSLGALRTNHDDQALAFLDAEIDNLPGARRWALQAAPETSL